MPFAVILIKGSFWLCETSQIPSVDINSAKRSQSSLSKLMPLLLIIVGVKRKYPPTLYADSNIKSII